MLCYSAAGTSPVKYYQFKFTLAEVTSNVFPTCCGPSCNYPKANTNHLKYDTACKYLGTLYNVTRLNLNEFSTFKPSFSDANINIKINLGLQTVVQRTTK